MRPLSVVVSASILVLVGTGSITNAAAPAKQAANWICLRAFTTAEESAVEPLPDDILDAAVKSCASVDDWLLAAAQHPGVLGNRDARTFLEDRCGDESAALAEYATCHSLGYESVEPSPISGPGWVAVRSSSTDQAPGPRSDVGIEIILDTSKSMRKGVGGVRRIDMAKDSLRILLQDALAEGVPLALRTFGSRKPGKNGPCRTALVAPLAPLDRRATLDLVDGLRAAKGTKSPIGAAIAAVARDLETISTSRTVVIVTDGNETCGGDPVGEIEALEEGGVAVTVNVVGFALDDQELRETMLTWAEAGQGRYFDATNANELAAAIAQAVAPAIDVPVTIVDPNGAVVGTTVVDGEPVEVEAGTYRVVVGTNPPLAIDDVIVESGEQIELQLPSPG